jgi:hypothetical protein
MDREDHPRLAPKTTARTWGTVSTARTWGTGLNKIVNRRNKIVHEGDIQQRKRGGKIKYNRLTPKEVANDIIWLSDLVDAIDAVVNQT